MSKFIAGNTYKTRSVTNSETFVTVKVLSRTAKTIRAETNEGEKTLRIGIHEGVEYVKPWGSYSMAPIVRAKL